MTAQQQVVPTSAHRVYVDAQTVRAQIAVLRHQYPEIDDDMQLLADSIEGQTNFSEVMAHLIRLEREVESFADAMEDQIEKLTRRRIRYQQKQQTLRTMMRSLMESAGQQKLTLPEATLSIVSGRAGCVVTNIEALPTEFVRTEHIPKKSEITAALWAGETVPGAEKNNPSTHLQIRT